jgi:Tol biopolymer transport system component
MDGTPPAVLLKDWQDIYSVVVTGSATGGAVVFMGKHPDGRAGIWRINLDGTGLTPVWLVGQSLPSGPTLGVPMAISPDGKRVVWWSPDRSLTNPRIRIWSANLDGSQLYEHTGSLLLDQMNFVCWSPDGTWFGFEAERTGQDSHVYRAVGARPAKQILAGPTRERLLAVSPDGKRIAFNAIEATGWQVLLANADGTGIRPLLAGFGEAVEWSPDGEQIVAALDAPGDTSKLVIAQADGSGARMTEITNSQPSPWRPRSP